jgi:hypothetical protein
MRRCSTKGEAASSAIESDHDNDPFSPVDDDNPVSSV